MNNSLDDKIIKGINYCANVDRLGKCEDCPIKAECDHDDVLIKTVADLINRQKAEIETLSVQVKCSKRIIQRLKERILTSRTEAIKECLEWVFSLFPEDKNFTTISRFTVKQKLKEMVGDE